MPPLLFLVMTYSGQNVVLEIINELINKNADLNA